MKRRREEKNGKIYVGKYRVCISLDEKAKDKLEALSLEGETTYSNIVESLVLGKKLQKKDKISSSFLLELTRIRTELNKIGSNVNQIAKNSNADFNAHYQEGNNHYLMKVSKYITTTELLLNRVVELEEKAFKNK